MHLCESQIVHFNYAFHAKKYILMCRYINPMLVTRANLQQPDIGISDSKRNLFGKNTVRSLSMKFFPPRFIWPFTVDENRLIHWESKRNTNDDYTTRAHGRYTSVNSILSITVNFHAFIMSSRTLDVLH